MKKTLAVFDFDGTIFNGDSFISFSIFTLGKVKFYKALFFALPKLLAWKAGIISNSQAKECLFFHLYSGMQYNYFLQACEKFKDVIDNNLIQTSFYSIQYHIKQNHEICILSASPELWIIPWAKGQKINSVIGTQIEVRDGSLTGHFSSKNCHGTEKVKRLKSAYPCYYDYQIWSYADSKSDKQIMDLAIHRIWV